MLLFDIVEHLFDLMRLLVLLKIPFDITKILERTLRKCMYTTRVSRPLNSEKHKRFKFLPLSSVVSK